MTRINFVDSDGSRHEVEAEDGQSLMQAARAAGLRGIVAECNGNASCATCHVYLEDDLAQCLPPPQVQEEDLLTFTASERMPGSRLSCQIVVDGRLEGATVQLPESQV